ncbi:uncharacterized protein LOC129592962 [Paramacrobiotus metropolitanus]|uniref:uncharacterized protein LOC129592962 n=1 Tax=Paramacrobiotus metropolitanus TaxID=2943436 RepID=UPI002445F48C|nr:uncharacterized protein LOC129592962 [Paramacrobiotus metropolitanus]
MQGVRECVIIGSLFVFNGAALLGASLQVARILPYPMNVLHESQHYNKTIAGLQMLTGCMHWLRAVLKALHSTNRPVVAREFYSTLANLFLTHSIHGATGLIVVTFVAYTFFEHPVEPRLVAELIVSVNRTCGAEAAGHADNQAGKLIMLYTLIDLFKVINYWLMVINAVILVRLICTHWYGAPKVRKVRPEMEDITETTTLISVEEVKSDTDPETGLPMKMDPYGGNYATFPSHA